MAQRRAIGLHRTSMNQGLARQQQLLQQAGGPTMRPIEGVDPSFDKCVFDARDSCAFYFMIPVLIQFRQVCACFVVLDLSCMCLMWERAVPK